MASINLNTIQHIKTISGRKKKLQEYLKIHPVGEISDEDDRIMKWLFERFYTTDEGHEKYPIENIDRFYIGYGSYQSICFHIRLKNGFDDIATLKRLSGENRTPYQNLKRALRHAIHPQIEDFKQKNPLDATATCPIEKCPLGEDAQVDHFNPTFEQLSENWLKENPNPTVIWGERGSSIYLLEEPYQSSWIHYHKEKANLRWLSKEGNKKAHRLSS